MNAERWKDQAEIGRDFFLFCLFTGMRPGEASRLRVDSVSLEKKCFVLRDSKNHTDFYLPFSGFVGKLLERRVLFSALEEKVYVFPSMGHHGKTETINLRRYTAAISTAVGGFVPNDMRRTFTTILANLDPPVSHLTTKRLLNHTSVVVDQSDVTAGYFGTDIDRLRPVVERISNEILRLCGQSLPPLE